MSAWPVVRITLLLNLARLFGLAPVGVLPMLCLGGVDVGWRLDWSSVGVLPVCVHGGVGSWNGCMSLVL